MTRNPFHALGSRQGNICRLKSLKRSFTSAFMTPSLAAGRGAGDPPLADAGDPSVPGAAGVAQGELPGDVSIGSATEEVGVDAISEGITRGAEGPGIAPDGH